MSENRFLPISQLPSFAEFDSEIHRMSWDFSLPPSADTERIAVDSRALRRVQSVVGFLSNHVREYVGDRSEYEVSITGINADGSATAGKAKMAKKAETNQTFLVDEIDDDPYDELMKNYFMTSPLHRFNRTEIASRVVDVVREQGVVREKAWANELNDAFVDSMNGVAYKHLIRRDSLNSRVIDSLTLTALIPINAVLNSDPLLISIGIASGYGMMSAVNFAKDSFINKYRYGESFFLNRRWTIQPFGDWQPDRYLATVALNSVSPLIRYRK